MYEWYTINQEAILQEAPEFAPWLIHAKHLKLALKQQGFDPQVQVLNQCEAQFTTYETALVGCDKGWIRQMYFKHEGSILTYGRTVVPQPTYQAFYEQFQTLGTRAIGETLLHDKSDVIREPLSFGFVERGSELFQLAVQDYDAPISRLWGRHSIFLIQGHPLLIIELLFPFILEK